MVPTVLSATDRADQSGPIRPNVVTARTSPESSVGRRRPMADEVGILLEDCEATERGELDNPQPKHGHEYADGNGRHEASRSTGDYRPLPVPTGRPATRCAQLPESVGPRM